MGFNIMIHSTKMSMAEVVLFCKKWNNYHEDDGEWIEEERYVDYDDEFEKLFTKLTDWRGSPVYQVHNWLVEHIENNSDHGGLFIITREKIEELSIVVDKLVNDLAEKLGSDHDIKDYLIDEHYWNHDKQNFSDAYSHYNLEFVQKGIKKILDLLDSDDEIILVYHSA